MWNFFILNEQIEFVYFEIIPLKNITHAYEYLYYVLTSSCSLYHTACSHSIIFTYFLNINSNLQI